MSQIPSVSIPLDRSHTIDEAMDNNEAVIKYRTFGFNEYEATQESTKLSQNQIIIDNENSQKDADPTTSISSETFLHNAIRSESKEKNRLLDPILENDKMDPIRVDDEAGQQQLFGLELKPDDSQTFEILFSSADDDLSKSFHDD